MVYHQYFCRLSNKARLIYVWNMEQEKLKTEILKTDLNHILSKPDIKNNKYMQIINETHGEEILFKKAN